MTANGRAELDIGKLAPGTGDTAERVAVLADNPRAVDKLVKKGAAQW
jgi:hypothetical protein